jgi:nucleotide-binding universal stress UspA family protein
MRKKRSRTVVSLPRIIVATDFSPASKRVVMYAALIARRYKSKLYLTHIIPSDAYKSVPAEVMTEALKQTQERARQEMALVQRLDCLKGLQFETLIQEGEVAPVLLGLAIEHDVSLVVLGTRGHRGLDRLLQGSVAEKVFRMASCPVLIVPPSDTREAVGVPIHTVLYPTNFSEESLRAAPFALSLAKRHRARLILLNVLEESEIEARDDKARLSVPVEERLRQLIPDKNAPSRGVLAFVEFGPVEQRVLRVAWENHAGIIVLGIAAAEPAVAHLEEGITYRIVREAPCPVFTTRS